jgi:hypothetical protein
MVENIMVPLFANESDEADWWLENRAKAGVCGAFKSPG